MNIIEHILQKKHLSYEQMQNTMHNIMHGNCTQEWIAGFLVAMRAKGMNSDELLASVEIMRKIVTPVNIKSKKVVDVVGTGGDGINTFNISTASMIVASSCGAKVAKHGNRSVSSKSGSADVLEELGVDLHQNAEQISKSIEEIGMGFMFAPNHHPAMKHVANVRKILGIHTFFNVLGPLTNPANVKRMIIGVYSKEWLEVIANVLLKLNFEHAWVVHSEQGMDEISSSHKTYVYEVKQGNIRDFEINPKEYGFKQFDISEIYANNAKESAKIILDVLNGKQGYAHDMIVINSASVLYISDIVKSLDEGIALAKRAIKEKVALEKLQQLI